MKRTHLLITTVLGTGLLLGIASPTHAKETITTNTVVTSKEPIGISAISDPKIAAQRFVAHVNYARVALAMENAALASEHIAQARNMIILITNATTEQRRTAHVTAGRVSYSYDVVHKYNYFPVETGPVEVKEMSNGPLWAKNSLAVSDADIVTLSVDLTDDTAEKLLAEAEASIAAGKLSEAEAKLGNLSDSVVTVENRVPVPIDKAHDNIALAQGFIMGKNYDGARFALGHADEALEEMQKNDVYKTHRAEIRDMRQDVKDMRDEATRKDPTLLQKSSEKLETWTKQLKKWANKNS